MPALIKWKKALYTLDDKPSLTASQCLRQYDLHLAVPDAVMGNKDKQMVPTHPHKEAAVKVNDLSGRRTPAQEIN